MMRRLLSGVAISLTLLTPLAYAADDQETARMERLERDIMLIQKQLARGELSPGTDAATSATAGNDIPTPTGPVAASAEVRLTQIEETLRKISGKLEESDFKVKQLTDKLDRMQKDTDLRFTQLQSGKKPGLEVPPEPAAAAAGKEAEKKPLPGAPKSLYPENDIVGGLSHEDVTGKPIPPLEKSAAEKAAAEKSEKLGETQPAADSKDAGTLKLPDSKSSPSARDQYNQAFKLLNQTKYDEAKAGFTDFIAKNPSDPLVGNAYYWLGETFYIRRDYVNASDTFRKGFEALPTGPKAADNLLKLSMSLSAMKKQKEACIVLDQILAKFSKSSASVTEKAAQERTRNACE